MIIRTEHDGEYLVQDADSRQVEVIDRAKSPPIIDFSLSVMVIKPLAGILSTGKKSDFGDH